MLLDEIGSASHSPVAGEAWVPYRNPTTEPAASTNCHTSVAISAIIAAFL